LRITVENRERSRTTSRKQILPLALLATLAFFFSVVGLLGLAIFSGSSAEAETEATRPAEPTPATATELSVIAEQLNQKDKSIPLSVQAVDEIDPGGEQQTQAASSEPAVVVDNRETDIADIDLDALQHVKAADWLLSKNPQQYLLQLRSGTDYTQMSNGAFTAAQMLEFEPSQGIVVFPFKNNKVGKTVYGFGIGPYKNATAARNAVSEMPQEIKQHDPWIRRLKDLQLAVAETNSGEIGNFPNPTPEQPQLEQTNSVTMETNVDNLQSEDAQQGNEIEQIIPTDIATRDVAFWVEGVAGVEELIIQESASTGVENEQTLPVVVLNEEPVLHQSRAVVPELSSQEIENNQEGPVLEFQPLEFEESAQRGLSLPHILVLLKALFFNGESPTILHSDRC